MQPFRLLRGRAWAICVLSIAPAQADAIAPPGPQLRRDAIYTMATVRAVAAVASEHCPPVRVTPDIDQLVAALGLIESDDDALNAETASLTEAFQNQVEHAGAKAWCEDVYARFGPSGTMVRGLLHQ